jgi:hypothetical protein
MPRFSFNDLKSIYFAIYTNKNIMMLKKIKIYLKLMLFRKELLILIYGSVFFSISSLSIFAHPKPLNAIEFNAIKKLHSNLYYSISSTSIIQNLSFGAFFTGSSGGMVIVPSIGSRRATGSIILIQSNPGYPAILRVTVDNTNIINLTTGNIVNLTNSSGGSVTLQINDFYPASSFSPIIGQNNVTIGGTLTVGSQASTPAGNYSGSFEVTFNEQ